MKKSPKINIMWTLYTSQFSWTKLTAFVFPAFWEQIEKHNKMTNNLKKHFPN